jgi:antitoxin YefM
MKAIAFKTAQTELSKIIDSVILTNKPVKISRREKHQTAVVISKKEYNQLLETSYLLNNTKNATRLNRAIKSLSQ